MRCHKFKAWDPDKKRMYSGDQIERYEHLESFLSYGEMQIYRVWNGEWHQLEPIQWTGLYDKNGEAIFEGDLLKDKDGIGEVEWVQEHCGYMVFTRNPSLYHKLESDGMLKNTEIIGNIYQHSHLMEATNE